MKMMDISDTIIAKSDQLNAADLIGGPITITITKVSKGDGEQPVAISYEGDNGKPFKPCKSVRRLLVGMWKKDATKYVGRRLTLYFDPKVTWAGKEEGGVRVSHASHIDGEFKMALRASKAKTVMTTVKPLLNDAPKPEPTPTFDFTTFESRITAELDATTDAAELSIWWETMKPDRLLARDADKTRAGQSASRVSEKLAELTNND